MSTEKNGNEGKKHKKGVRPVIVPREVSEWIRNSSTNAQVQSFRVGKLK